MKEQNYANHKKFSVGYHFVTAALLLVLSIASVYTLYVSFKTSTDMRYAVMFFLILLVLIFNYTYLRAFALKAQDRAIRAEENLRHYVITGKLSDPKLSMSQIIALRFASDEEFVLLSQKASKEDLKSDDIKKAIKNWRADHNRL
ncbi:MAG: DUF6526 family protein [bacterium]|nr:DUF6526 family protein [bacterium]